MAGIFKSYDVRGTVPDELNTGDAYRIGKASVAAMRAKRIAVSRDARIHGPDIQWALMAGISAAGAEAIDIGMGPTPLSYFAAGFMPVDGAIQVTASHNPPQYNGFKFTARKALPMSYDTGINRIEELYGRDEPKATAKPGRITAKNIFPAYRRHLRKFARIERPLKAAIDTGNGVLGASLPALLKGLPIKVVPLLFKPDGRFPVHEPNPLKPENLEMLRKAVVAKKCDVGIAFDGDGDRLAMVDETGAPIPGDTLLCLMAAELLRREKKGAAVLYDLRSSKAVPRAIEAAGGRAVETRVGHSHIKAALRREKAVLAGELSGHYYFRDFYCSDSGEMALFTVLSLLSSQTKPISELVAPHRLYHHTGEINFEVENADAVLAAVKAKYSASAKKIYELDGVSVDFGDWWFNIRKSNTEPVVRLNLESLVSAAHRDEKKEEVVALICGRRG